jgi:hypothetical protein
MAVKTDLQTFSIMNAVLNDGSYKENLNNH